MQTTVTTNPLSSRDSDFSTGSAFPALHRRAHLLDPVIRRARDNPQHIVATYRRGPGFAPVTAREFLERIYAIAKGLVASGVEPGDRVALMCRTRLEWIELDYAIIAAGAITVPVYETASPDQVQWIVADSGATLAILESESMRPLLAEPGETAAIEALVVDSGALRELIDRGRDVGDEALERRIAALVIDDVATIVYTSGTTGRPKGCVLTHRNLRMNVLQTLEALGSELGEGDRTLLFLPLAHVFSKIVALSALERGIALYFATDQRALADELQLARPTMIAAVPRVFDKLYEAARHRSEERGKRWLFDRAAEIAVRVSKARSDRRRAPLASLEHALYDRLVYRPIRAALGGSLRLAFSGASALGERLTHFFNGAGVQVMEGYGLTETSPVLTVNRLDRWRPGTVGQPVIGTELRIAASDGEVLARGPQVFRGYWRDEVATRSVLSPDGWFHTGDVGTLQDGFLRITGRKKDLIVTAGGKNVAPGPLEDRLREHPLVEHALVVGDGRPFVAALVTIDETRFRSWRMDRPDVPVSVADAIDHPELRAAVQEAVEHANTLVSRAESIRAFAILPVEFTVEGGELTPTLKVRRGVVAARFAPLIDRIYKRSAPMHNGGRPWPRRRQRSAAPGCGVIAT